MCSTDQFAPTLARLVDAEVAALLVGLGLQAADVRTRAARALGGLPSQLHKQAEEAQNVLEPDDLAAATEAVFPDDPATSSEDELWRAGRLAATRFMSPPGT